MSYVLFNALQDLAEILGDLYTSTFSYPVNSGSAVALEWDEIRDSTLLTFAPSNNLSNGILFLPPFTVPAVTGSPTYHYSVTPTQSGSSLTFTQFDAGNGQADNTTYRAIGNEFPKYVLINSVNAALQEMGPFVYTKEYTTTASTDEYPIPETVVAVEIASSGSAPYGWARQYFWDMVSGSATGEQQLRFDVGKAPATADMPMRVFYLDAHPLVTADDDEIHQDAPRERLKWTAAVHAWRWRYQRVNKEDPGIVEMINESKTLAEKMAMKYPMRKIPTIKLNSV
jgi:hypothetical protein